MATAATATWRAARPRAAEAVVAKATGRLSETTRAATATAIQVRRGRDAVVSSRARVAQPRTVLVAAAPMVGPSATVVGLEPGNWTPRCTPATWVTTTHDAAAVAAVAATAAWRLRRMMDMNPPAIPVGHRLESASAEGASSGIVPLEVFRLHRRQ